MTPKQRVLKTLNHCEPDQIPLDMGASAITSIHYIVYNNLMKHLGKDNLVQDRDHTEFMDIVQGIVQVPEEFVRDFKIDARGFVPGSFRVRWEGNVQQINEDYIISDLFGGIWSCPPSGYYFDQRPGSFPMAAFKSASEIEKYVWPELISPEVLSGLRKILLELDPQYALLIGEPIGGIFNTCFKLRGYNTFFMDLADNVDIARCIMAHLTQIKMDYWDKVLQEAGDLIDVIVLEDDIGHQNTTMISPSMYRKLIKPYHQELISFIRKKALADTKIMLHSCGSVYKLIPDLIEIGIDILNPIQTTAADMDTARLKKEFGSDLVFWGGGADIQNVLPFGTPSKVEYEVKKRIDDLAPGGGFIFAATHNIQPKTPPENIMKMWEVFQNNCFY